MSFGRTMKSNISVKNIPMVKESSWWHCRAVLLSHMCNIIRSISTAQQLDDITSYSVGITPTCINHGTLEHHLLQINDAIANIIPGIKEPVLGIELRSSNIKEEAIFHFQPEVLQYGWAINGLLIGYLRGLCWPDYHDKTHLFDVYQIDKRLKLWWANDWATDPEITWYTDQHDICIEKAAFGSIFNRHHGITTHHTYISKWLNPGSISEFCQQLIESDQVGTHINPSYDENNY